MISLRLITGVLIRPTFIIPGVGVFNSPPGCSSGAKQTLSVLIYRTAFLWNDIHPYCISSPLWFPLLSYSPSTAQPNSAWLNMDPLSDRGARSVWMLLSSLSHSTSESFHIHYVSGWSPASDIWLLKAHLGLGWNRLPTVWQRWEGRVLDSDG